MVRGPPSGICELAQPAHPKKEPGYERNSRVENGKGFERIEEQKIGVGKHEEFHKMIDQLESAYLK
jgi:hypothetical protein